MQSINQFQIHAENYDQFYYHQPAQMLLEKVVCLWDD